MATSVILALCAGDTVWAIVDYNKPTRSIRKGLIRMISTENISTTPAITYHIRLTGDPGTTKFEETEPPANIFAFADLTGALARYSSLLTA